jgi:ABC-type antimicrobial peptide transport system permease subunit
MNLVVRTANDPMGILAAVRAIVHVLDPGVPLAEARSLETLLGATIARERFSAILLSVLAGAALILSALGIYGVVAYTVSARIPEIGLRLALGATPSRLVLSLLRDASMLVIPGLLAGFVGSQAVSGLLGRLLFETSPRDAAVLACAPAILLFVALAAAYLPARRAARLDPLPALRRE